MAVNVATLVARLEADIRDFDRDMKRANRRLDQLEGGTRKANLGLGKLKGAFAAVGVAVVARKIGMLGKEMVGLAVDAEEAASAFRVTFGKSVNRAQRFVDEFAVKAGFARHELEQMLAVTGNIVQGLGATEEASFQLSERMATLAGDVASFSNAAGGAPAVLRALQSALTGEREALKTYGIVISEAEVQTEAFRITGKKTVTELTRLEKAQATVNLAYQGANKAVGDLDATADSAANTIRRIEGRITEMKTAIGKELLPVIERLLPLVETLVITIGPKLVKAAMGSAKWISAIAGIFDKDARHFANFLGVMEQLNEEWLDNADGASKFYAGLRELDRVASLTPDNFDNLANALGLTNAETLLGAEAMRDWLIAHDIPADQITGWIYEVQAALEAEQGASMTAAAAAYDLGEASGTAATAQDRMKTAVQGVTTALQAQWAEVQKQINPLFRLQTASDQVVETQSELVALQASGKQGTEAYRRAVEDFARANLELQMAQAVTPSDLYAGAQQLEPLLSTAMSPAEIQSFIRSIAPSLSGYTTTTINIDNIEITGVLDPSNPTSARDTVRELEEALALYNSEVGIE